MVSSAATAPNAWYGPNSIFGSRRERMRKLEALRIPRTAMAPRMVFRFMLRFRRPVALVFRSLCDRTDGHAVQYLFQVPEPARIVLSVAAQPGRARSSVAGFVLSRKILKADGADFDRLSMAIDKTTVGSLVMPGDRTIRHIVVVPSIRRGAPIQSVSASLTPQVRIPLSRIADQAGVRQRIGFAGRFNTGQRGSGLGRRGRQLGMN